MEKFRIEEASRISGITPDDFIAFYMLKGYIRKEPNGFSATALGIEKGCVINEDGKALFTLEALLRIASAFAA